MAPAFLALDRIYSENPVPSCSGLRSTPPKNGNPSTQPTPSPPQKTKLSHSAIVELQVRARHLF